MAQKIRDVMTKSVTTVRHESTLVDAARLMHQNDIGDVLVQDGDKLCGIVTDRDIVVRAVAEERDPSSTTVGEICSHELFSLTPDATIEEAKKMMSDRAVRRLPVIDKGKPVGIVSLGDIAIEQSGERPLEDISSAPSNN